MEVFREMLITFFTAAIPIVELRGAIPLGLAFGLPRLEVYLLAVAGNMLPVPFVILLIRRIFALLRRLNWFDGFVTRMERKAEQKGEFILRYRAVGLIILVALPLPGTGAWTGALAATFLNIRLRNAFAEILLGVLIAGAIVLGVSCGFLHFF